ncbi:hypothetical protein CLOSTMETH_01844 [[Clostridium] methylpentosum DSM 5476]|jgi:hypothetical protein|uniref:Transcriptional regulator, MerR family n=1 Tax=[Clostridium] methylpentosum DSM 5476 TaxID=537013 RepID=C0EDB7_9FIRM|nr:hypothetical protein CLOSTMETH_01844 [[Clostridium] methylpentosum DSM 5476]MDY3990029.1 hypothetical protein [Massilioclostridium sp.]MEE1491168.1 hypothetical protein [Massilioclostridium sp.]
MPQYTSTQAILQNLKDAGCDPKTVEQFLLLRKAGDRKEQLKLLSIHRKQLLDKVHREEKRIDCLDYLVYQIKKEA